jgi:hypothetical protein
LPVLNKNTAQSERCFFIPSQILYYGGLLITTTLSCGGHYV